MNFSTKSSKLDSIASSNIKKPIDTKGKHDDKKSSDKNKDKSERDKKSKIIIIEEKDEKINAIEDNVDFEAFFDEELKQKEEEKQRELRRMRLEQIKNLNEKTANTNKDNTEVFSLQSENLKEESIKAKLPSKNETNNNNNKFKDDEKSLLVINANNFIYFTHLYYLLI